MTIFRERGKSINYFVAQKKVKFWAMLYIKELEDLALSGRILGKIMGVPNILHLLTTLNICTQILENYRRLAVAIT